MSFSIFPAGRMASALLSLTAIGSVIFAQTPQQPADQAEVIRISTELVQTGVVVLDKQGRFVEGLKPEQFLLKVDGKPVTPTFFEHVIAGSAREEKLEATVGRGATSQTTPAVAPSTASYRGRTIIFFIDDLHLSQDSVNRTRKAMLEFVDKQMSVEDRVAVASPSGQIGFLQRFTDLKPVVRAAVGRLNYKPYNVRDHESIPMTEYQALRIDSGDSDATNYYVTELLKANTYRLPVGGGLGPPSGGPLTVPQPRNSVQGGMTREGATRIVKERAGFLMRQSEVVTGATLSTLESLMRASTEMPGRKLVFFISDGFFLHDHSTAFGDKLRRITDAAVRAGVVVYSMDARGMTSMTDASSNRADPEGRLSRANIGELQASQDALNALAVDTGGKAILTGRLTEAVNDALRETSNYYLLAWRPSTEEQKGANFKRVEVSIIGRSDLTVRQPRGFLVSEPKTDVAKNAPPAGTTPAPNAPKGADAAIMSALANPIARSGLPTKLSVSFVDVPNSGPVLTIASQMATDVLGYGADGKQPAAIDLGGVVLNDLGKQAGSFKTRINVKPTSNASVQNPGVIYTHKIPLKPGIYQVRIAARDDKSGRVGSATQWMEIPDLTSRHLTLSSLMVGGQFIGSEQKTGSGASEQMQFSVDRRFTRGAHLNFLTIIYNASRGAAGNAAPDLEAQIKISRNGQAIISSPQLKVAIDANTDPARIVYGADVGLQKLTAGRYLLEVTVSDRVAKTSGSQQIGFEVE